MKTLPVSPIDSDTESKVRELRAAQTPLPQVIVVMRSLGLDKIDSIKMLRAHAGLSTSEAKGLVHLSEAWADRLGDDDAFHESAVRAAKEAGCVEEAMKVSA